MKKTEELLHIIERGDPTKILSEDDLVQRLNFLLKYQLITITEDKIILTEKGKEARVNGIQTIIEEEELNKQLIHIPKKNDKEKSFWKSFLKRLKRKS